ncbi:MAG: TonB-dependent receptor plug domain-containing protein [Steroidobacteraceae bacterium]
MLGVTTAWANAPTFVFDIPPSSADEALGLFARQTDVPLIFPYEVAKRIRVRGLKGTYSTTDGIEQLLRDTCLKAVASSGGSSSSVSETNIDAGIAIVQIPNCRYDAALQSRPTGLAVASRMRHGSREETPARIEEVIVTATRREESAQDVPISLTAFNADDLTNSGMRAPLELSRRTTGLVMNQQNGGLTPFIRGVGSLDVSAGQENSVAMYVDGVYTPASYGNVFSFNNIERVEILKGPQGTLFGRNSAGGLVHVVTRTPSAEPNAYGTLSYGTFQTAQSTVYGTTGLGEHLAADIAAVYVDQGKGYGHNITTGSEVNQMRETLVRSKWLYTPTEYTRVSASFSYVDSHRQQGAGRQFFPGVIAFFDQATTYTGHYQDITGGVDPQIDALGKMAALNVDQKVGGLSFKSLSAYQRLNVFQTFDNDLTPLSFIDVDIDDQRYATFTQELQLLSNPQSAIKWIVGAFYLHDESGFRGPHGLGLFGAGFANPSVPGSEGVGFRTIVETDSYAAFGELTYPLTNAMNLTAGARYTWDERTLDGQVLAMTSFETHRVLVRAHADGTDRNGTCACRFIVVLQRWLLLGLQ